MYIKEIHYNQKWITMVGCGGNIQQVRIFTIIAILILLIACINFMNLTTARHANRAREVGMCKVVGAQRKDIISQFFGESLFLSFVALIFAIILTEILMSVFNSLSGKSLDLAIFVSCPGLFGLASFMEQNIEIDVRINGKKIKKNTVWK